MKTFLIDEELRDNLMFYVKDFRELGTGFETGLNLDAAYRRNLLESEKTLANLPEVVTAEVPVPTVDMLTDVVYQDNTALLTNVEALYIARAVHALLTKGRGGA